VSTPEVAVIMVNWNGGDTAVQCAQSVLTQDIDVRLIVADNASTDGSPEAILKACPNTLMIHNSQNRGYALGNNQALKHIGSADYVLWINNDVILLDPHGVREVIRAMEADPNIRGACGRYEYPDGRFQRYYNQLPTLFNMVVSWGAGKYIMRLRNSPRTSRYICADVDFESPAKIEQPAFACVLTRAACVRTIGDMDETLPIFFNDVDYCWRWRAQGWTWHYFPSWRIAHHHSKSLARIGDLTRAEVASSAIRFARKHFSRLELFGIQTSICLELLWRRWHHRDVAVRIRDVWKGRLFFCNG
jgi:N-acetylglucosaminyl-diphospho-decaprenol L-rhamnosyltransferase